MSGRRPPLAPPPAPPSHAPLRGMQTRLLAAATITPSPPLPLSPQKPRPPPAPAGPPRHRRPTSASHRTLRHHKSPLLQGQQAPRRPPHALANTSCNTFSWPAACRHQPSWPHCLPSTRAIFLRSPPHFSSPRSVEGRWTEEAREGEEGADPVLERVFAFICFGGFSCLVYLHQLFGDWRLCCIPIYGTDLTRSDGNIAISGTDFLYMF